jgi:hypothetical protein
MDQRSRTVVVDWRDEKAVVRWRTEREHHGVQQKGRFEIFEDYHLCVGEVTDDSDPPRGLAVDPTTTRRNRRPAIRIELATGDWLRPSWP